MGTTSDRPNGYTAIVRRQLGRDDLDRIDGAIQTADDTGQLLRTALTALYDALSASTSTVAEGQPTEGSAASPVRFAIPTSQWQAIVSAITNRAQAWGTSAEVGLDLATTLMPDHYDDPTVPAPNFRIPDHRPAEHRLTFSRDATDVIGACETYLDRLRSFYGPQSDTYQAALHSWHRNLASLLTAALGGAAVISRDGELSLFIQAASGLAFALVFHGSARHCSRDGCGALIDDDGTARPAQPGAVVPDHRHSPTYPVVAPRPGTWSLHS